LLCSFETGEQTGIEVRKHHVAWAGLALRSSRNIAKRLIVEQSHLLRLVEEQGGRPGVALRAIGGMSEEIGSGKRELARPATSSHRDSGSCDLFELVYDRAGVAAFPLTRWIAGLSGPKPVLSGRTAVPDRVIARGLPFLFVRRHHADSGVCGTAAGPLARRAGAALRRFCAIALNVWPEPASVAEMPVDFCQRRIAPSTAA
jgi:hypothetical protein